ncbi:MAG: acylphosphatase [Bacteroidetes bacterium GWA2_31_9b]|nr:MAG: acylphosphatase [Bacteroidetes bacterium GWA2_31_9b]
MKKALMIIVSGNVQGVGFRYSALKKANELGIKGYIRNKSDGTVYIEIEGEPETLDFFIVWCKNGPSWAQVNDVYYEDIPLSNFVNFEIK